MSDTSDPAAGGDAPESPPVKVNVTVLSGAAYAAPAMVAASAPTRNGCFCKCGSEAGSGGGGSDLASR